MLNTIILAPWIVLHPWHAEWVAEMIPPAAQFPYFLTFWIVFCWCGVALPISPLLWIFCKWHIRDRRELLHQLHSFTLAGAQCQEEGDRTYVVARIEEWFGGVS